MLPDPSAWHTAAMSNAATPALLAALGSALGIGSLALLLRSPQEEPPNQAPLTAFSHTAQEAPAQPPPVVGEDARLALDRVAAAVGRGAADQEVLMRTCAGVAKEAVCDVLTKHPTWGLVAAQRVAEGEVVLGATAAQVEATWGPPPKKQAEGDRVLWCYETPCVGGMVLMNDRVVALKE